jgi:hypothetical protein
MRVQSTDCHGTACQNVVWLGESATGFFSGLTCQTWSGELTGLCRDLILAFCLSMSMMARVCSGEIPGKVL